MPPRAVSSESTVGSADGIRLAVVYGLLRGGVEHDIIYCILRRQYLAGTGGRDSQRDGFFNLRSLLARFGGEPVVECRDARNYAESPHPDRLGMDYPLWLWCVEQEEGGPGAEVFCGGR